jgi:hypothetical protein
MTTTAHHPLRPTRQAQRVDMARRAATHREPLPALGHATGVRRRATAFTPMAPDPTP